MSVLERKTERALRAPSGFAIVLEKTDGTTMVAGIVRSLEFGGTTIRVRPIGTSASALVRVAEVKAARLASRAEIQAVADQAAQSSERRGAEPDRLPRHAASSGNLTHATDPGITPPRSVACGEGLHERNGR